MTKKVMKSAIDDSTMLGGVWFRPSADRSIEKTITKRVKLVMITKRPGAMESTVISATSWITRPASVARSSDPVGASLSASVIDDRSPPPASCALAATAPPSSRTAANAASRHAAKGCGRAMSHASGM